MANPEHLAKLLEGVLAWNTWRAGRDIQIDLSWSDLAGRDLTGADLRYANFEHCNLRGTILGPGTTAWNADFNSADMYQANLHGAELPDTDFTNADLYEATLREANLRCAKLAECRGALRQHQLAGADITGAILPSQLDKLLSSLDNVKSISESARKIFLAVLVACIYCWLTIATTTDLNLITNRISSPLPIIQTAIPIVSFYVVAPLLLIGVYFYFHFYLQKLWEELGTLPAFLQDGCPLHAKVDPWLLNDLVRSHLPRLDIDRPFLSYLQLWISVLLAWWLVPITLFLFWGRYLRRHEWLGTTLHIVLFTISLVSAFCLYRLAIATLRYVSREPFDRKHLLQSRPGYRRTTLALLALTISVLILFGLLSLGVIEGSRPGDPLFKVDNDTKKLRLGYDASDPRTWVPRLTNLFGFSAFADLRNSDVSTKSATWTRQNERDSGSVTGAKLRKANLRFAYLAGAFLSSADLDEADLTGADISLANISFANISKAHLNGADLSGANLTEADLTEADLTNSVLNEAHFFSANLTRVNLTKAFLYQADLTGATLRQAHLNGAFLTEAHLNKADLNEADLSEAHLIEANLNEADLSEAKLNKANLNETDLTGAIFRHADLKGTHLAQANLNHAAFQAAQNLDISELRSANNCEQAFYDRRIIEDLGFFPDHNEKLAQQQDKETEAAVP